MGPRNKKKKTNKKNRTKNKKEDNNNDHINSDVCSDSNLSKKIAGLNLNSNLNNNNNNNNNRNRESNVDLTTCTVVVDKGMATETEIEYKTKDIEALLTECYHGWDQKETSDKRRSDYCNTLTLLLENKNNPNNLQTICQVHRNILTDPQFVKYLFSCATTQYLNDDCNTRMVSAFLRMGLELKYQIVPWLKGEYASWMDNKCKSRDGTDDKSVKYMLDTDTERGIIIGLHRETKEFCHCMKAKNMEAKTMEKVTMCKGCKHEFPKANLRKCKSCGAVKYCSHQCQIADWSRHKIFCQAGKKG